MPARRLFALWVSCSPPCWGVEPPADAELPALVRQLSDDSFRRREAAQARLEALPYAAVVKLRRLAFGLDPEAAERLRGVLDSLEAARTGFQTLAEAKNLDHLPAFGTDKLGRVSLTVHSTTDLSIESTEIELTLVRPTRAGRLRLCDVAAEDLPLPVGPFAWLAPAGLSPLDGVLRDDYGLRILDAAGRRLRAEALAVSLGATAEDGTQPVTLLVRVRTPVGNKPARVLVNGTVGSEE